MTRPAQSRRSLTGALSDLYRSRGLLLGFLATALGLLCILVASPADPTITTGPDGTLTISTPDTLWSSLRIYDVGVAVFQAGLTITIFQVLLNQVAEDRFVEMVRGALVQQEDGVRTAVAQSLAAGSRLESLRLAPDELDRVIENAARLRSGSAELGTVISRKLRSNVFESDERWRNLVVRAEIFGLDEAKSSGRQHDYYDVFLQFGYHTTDVARTRFTFKVGGWQDDYDRLLRARDMGVVWRLPSTGEFDERWDEAFTLLSVNFGGQQVQFQRNDVEREYVAFPPAEEFADRSDVFVQYSFRAKVLADGNLLSFEVPKPTFSATYSISVSVPDIARIRALDFFGLTRPASVEYAPSLQDTRFIAISVDDWILPKAGAAVVWKRR
ncbi:hypothetical protein ABT336_04435 [Micromonospora sp. NPDC000207]|uniref:hypothetical protein n=1 Tax=Micromonospora sp. NPDC000207 TaxID=3154246 RepID=UPI003328F386